MGMSFSMIVCFKLKKQLLIKFGNLRGRRIQSGIKLSEIDIFRVSDINLRAMEDDVNRIVMTSMRMMK